MRKVRFGLAVVLALALLSLVLGRSGTIDTTLRNALPSLSHIAGCDSLGRDLLSLSMRGLTTSLFISLSSALLAVLGGTMLALLSSGKSFFSGMVRGITEAMKVLPPVVLALLFIAVGGNGIGKVIAAIAISSSASVARTLHGVVSTILGEDHVESARALGLRRRRIWRNHILPSLIPYIREHFASIALSAILTESSLSYLGLGVGATVVTLGSILSDGKGAVLSYPHVVVFPALLLLLLSFSFLFVSRGLSEIDPSLQ